MNNAGLYRMSYPLCNMQGFFSSALTFTQPIDLSFSEACNPHVWHLKVSACVMNHGIGAQKGDYVKGFCSFDFCLSEDAWFLQCSI